MNYDFFAPGAIHFGWGRRAECGQLAARLGTRAFLVVGSRTLQRTGEIFQLSERLREAGVEPVLLSAILREPEVSDVDALTAQLCDDRPGTSDLVLGIGGGSAIDLAKAVAAMATNRHGASVRDFLEGVGRGLKLEHPPLPLMAMPTTAGTGTEATKNAVISSYDPPFKKSLRSDLLIPRIVLIDPELSVSVPPHITAQTGMDAITQLIESFISRRAQPIPDALCLHGIRLAFGSIVEAVEQGTSRPARENMAHAALLSGLSLANAGLGMAHGVAAALGVHAKVPHGLACAMLLPAALEANRECSVGRLSQLASAALNPEDCPADPGERVEAFLASVRQINRRIGIPERLGEVGITADRLPAIVKISRGNSMSGNPRELSDSELHRILETML